MGNLLFKNKTTSPSDAPPSGPVPSAAAPSPSGASPTGAMPSGCSGQKHPMEESLDTLNARSPHKKFRQNHWQPDSSTFDQLWKKMKSNGILFDHVEFGETEAIGHPKGTTLLDVTRVVIHNMVKAMEEAPDQKVVKCEQINTDGGIKLLASRKDFKEQYAANLLFFGIIGDKIHDCREHLGESTYTFFMRTGVLTPVLQKWFDQMLDLLIGTVDPTLTRDKIKNSNFDTNISHWMTQFEKGCWSNAGLIEMMENRNNTGQLSHELVSGLYWPFVQLADNLMPAFAALVDKSPVPRELQYITDDEYKNWPAIKENRKNWSDIKENRVQGC